MEFRFKQSRSRLLKKVASLILGVGFAVLFYYKADFTWHEVLKSLINPGWAILLGSSLFTALFYYVSAAKWLMILDDITGHKTECSISNLFHYTSVGLMSSFILPRALGDVAMKSLLLQKDYGIPLRTGAYSVLVDQFFNLIVTIVFIIPGAFLLTDHHDLHSALTINMLSIATFTVAFLYFSAPALVFIAKSYAWALRIVNRIPFLHPGRPSGIPEQFLELPISSVTARKVFMLTLIRQIPMVMRLYVIVLLLGIDLNFYYLLLACSAMSLLGVISFTPAQLGIGEWGWFGLLSLAHLPEPHIAVFVLSSRIYSNLSILAIFLFTWVSIRISHSLLQRQQTGISMT